jgi:hypothetical protein
LKGFFLWSSQPNGQEERSCGDFAMWFESDELACSCFDTKGSLPNTVAIGISELHQAVHAEVEGCAEVAPLDRMARVRLRLHQRLHATKQTPQQVVTLTGEG